MYFIHFVSLLLPPPSLSYHSKKTGLSEVPLCSMKDPSFLSILKASELLLGSNPSLIKLFWLSSSDVLFLNVKSIAVIFLSLLDA